MKYNSGSSQKISLERTLLLSPKFSSPTPAIFVDRDGVLIEDVHYLDDPDHVALCPGAKTLLEEAGKQGWPVVVITNQSGISRGFFEWIAYERVTKRLLTLLGGVAPVAAIYANGYGPDAPKLSWRKPSPGMLLAAAVDLQLDLGRSVLIGDRLTDLQAGAQAGLPWLAHVLTGHGQQERHDVEKWSRQVNGVAFSFELMLLESLKDFPFHRLARTP